MISRVRSCLPKGWHALCAEATAEGFGSAARVAREWESGACRFDAPAEALLAAHADGELLGIGGITRDPYVPGALRMRRFYVRVAARRVGTGRALAMALLASSRDPDQLVVVNAGTTPAHAFWESLGFVPDYRHGHTHRLNGG